MKSRNFRSELLTFKFVKNKERHFLWIVGFRERDNPNNYRYANTNKRDWSTIAKFVRAFVEPGSTLVVDGWAVYRRACEVNGVRYVGSIGFNKGTINRGGGGST